ncbi:hypothetical protein [Kurthia sibirica]|uniref:Type I-B CRISPR-associated protein Cas8b1/Cst1 n=1 Tax=Kurthia sibirica TaxID=202750 RepID=A0A2U3AIV4_9BACL|nr:hypothetical protein [Kurthia sibirica]PWI24479.1 hypothetical protein DEX24_13540 [Kurthia sibirica]GEK35340.1 hypothetical protein KSI01_28730 [Kurthia sibirica]
MNKIIQINDWLFNMGATALLRLDKSNSIKVDANRLEVPIEWIEGLPERLFTYLIQKYSRGENTVNWLVKMKDYAKSNSNEESKKEQERYKDATKRFLSTVKESMQKVIKYFPDEIDITENLEKKCELAVEMKDFEELVKTIDEIKLILLRSDINEKLTLNYVKAMILAPASGQVSFLNVTKNKMTREEQQNLFFRDFIEPIILENTLRNLLKEANQEELQSFLHQSEYLIAKEWRKEHKKVKEVEISWFERYPKCAALGNEWGTLPYEEKMFMPLGSTSLNDRWDGQESNIQMISPLARLLLFLSPLGCVNYKKKMHNTMDENVFAFLHIEGDCLETLERNNSFSSIIKAENSLVDALQGTHKKQLKVEDEKRMATVLVEWCTESKVKKTLLEYRWIEEKFYLYVLNEDYISKIFPSSFREQLIQQHLRNYDTKMILQNELYEQLRKGNLRNTFSVKQGLIIRELMMGGKNMSTEKGKNLTDQMYNTGFSLRKALTGDGSTEQVTEQYKAPISKKLDSTIYRILNAAKSGNRKLFFELVIRLNILAGRKVSKEFTQCLDSTIVNDAKFSTISLAFVAGLMGVNSNKGEKENGENN